MGTKKIEYTDWGTIYYFNYQDYNFALYIYDDDKQTAYLSNVKVEESSRGKGLGNVILTSAEQESIKLKVNLLCLKVLRSSWVHEWYKRHGFKDFFEDEDPKYIWMKKPIK